jgi:signal transduction histidine kinase
MFYRREDREAGLPEKLIERATREGKAIHEGWRVRKDGSAFWGSIVITALHDPEGRVVGFTKVTRDLTERKQAEDKLVRYARQLEAQNKELQQFAYAAAHDMKEPLRKIMMYYSAIFDENGGPLPTERMQAYMRRSSDAAGRMLRLIDDLLAYSRVAGSDQPLETIDLNLLVADVITQFQDSIDQLGGKISCDRLPVVRGVAFQFRQLFDNLLSNSIKYRSKDRPLAISITAYPALVPEKADVYGAERFVRIEVRDNGIGFPPEMGEKIFNMFERLHRRDQYSGTGIGLAICHRIMVNNRGFIRARGMPDQGAIFELFFRAE